MSTGVRHRVIVCTVLILMSKYTLVFDVTRCEPDRVSMFMENGGALDSISMPWETEFWVTGSETSVYHKLDARKLTRVSIPIPESATQISNGMTTTPNPYSVVMRPDVRLGIGAYSMVSTLNGTIALSSSSEGSEYISSVLACHTGVETNTEGERTKGTHSHTGLVYKEFKAFAASIVFSNARVLYTDPDNQEKKHECVIQFPHVTECRRQGQGTSFDVLQKYYFQAKDMRENQLVYSPCPGLTKSIFKETVGIDGKGYSPLHDAVDRESAFSDEVLDELFNVTINSYLPEKGAFDAFSKKTKRPGIEAATQAEFVAGAVSMMVNYLCAYNKDGRCTVTSQGLKFENVESWLRQVARGPIDCNDCDGSALMAIGLINQAVKCTNEKLKHLTSVKNAIYPFYQVALVVVAARSAEATCSGGGNSAPQGHAIAVLLPTHNVVEARLKGLKASPDKEIHTLSTGTVTCDTRSNAHYDDTQMEAELEKLKETAFPQSLRSSMCDTDVQELDTWCKSLLSGTSVPEGQDRLGGIKHLSIEGTSPASPRLYCPDASARAECTIECEQVMKALCKMGPTAFRPWRMMHVGGADAGSTHSFYVDFCEATFCQSSPMFSGQVSQFVFVRLQDAYNKTDSAGASPRDVFMGNYKLVPLCYLTPQEMKSLNDASKKAKSDVMPKREYGEMKLDDFQSRNLQESISALQELGSMQNNCGKGHEAQHCVKHVTYIPSYNMLIHNPKSVRQFVDAAKQVAVQCVIEKKTINGLAQSHSGDQAGNYFMVDLWIPV